MDTRTPNSQLESLSDAYIAWGPTFWRKGPARLSRLAQDDTWDPAQETSEADADPLADAGKRFPVLGLLRSTSFRSWLTFAATFYITVSWVQSDFRLQRLNFNRELLLLLSLGVACWWQPSATRRRLRALLCRLVPQHSQREKLLSGAEHRVSYGLYSRVLVALGTLMLGGAALGIAHELKEYPKEVAFHSFSASLGALEQANVLRLAINKTDEKDGDDSAQGCDVTLDLTTSLSLLHDWGCHEFAKDGTPGLLSVSVETTLPEVALSSTTGWRESKARDNEPLFTASYQLTGRYFPPLVLRYRAQPSSCSRQFVQRAKTTIHPWYRTHCRMPKHAALALGDIPLEAENEE